MKQIGHAARRAPRHDLSLQPEPVQAYFGTKATNIQRHWRGFWSRKYLFDFYARKRYLEHVARINAQVKLVYQFDGCKRQTGFSGSEFQWPSQ